MQELIDPLDIAYGEAMTQQERDELAYKQAVADIGAMMEIPAGQRFLARLLRWTAHGQCVFTNSGVNGFLQGQQSVGIHVYEQMKRVDLVLAAKLDANCAPLTLKELQAREVLLS